MINDSINAAARQQSVKLRVKENMILFVRVKADKKEQFATTKRMIQSIIIIIT